MRYDLSDDQLLFRDTVTRFLSKEWTDQRLRTMFDSGRDLDDEIWAGIMDLGCGAVLIPQAYGGLGMGVSELAVVSEAFGAAAMGGPFIAHALATLAIVEGGSKELKSAWLPKLSTGEAIATVALQDELSGGGWRPQDWKFAPGETLSGVKEHVMSASNADLMVVALGGGQLALVEVGRGGVTVLGRVATDRTRTIARVAFDNAPATLLDPAASERVCDAGLILLAADACGGSRRILDMAVDYTKLRRQFGRAIAGFQGVRHQLADTAIMIEPNSALTFHAAALFDDRDPASPRIAATAKAHISECFVAAARRCLELHGGIGYTWEYPAHIWLRRAMFDWAYLGSPQSLRARVANLAGW